MALHRVVLLRHGRTAWNVDRRMQGRLDPELDEVGEAQAAEAAPLLTAFSPVRLVASDQRRAWRTAEIAASATGVPPRPEPRLRETSVGEWEGHTGDEVEAGWPGGIDTWRSDPTFAPPGGESRCDVAARAVPVVDDLAEELADVPEATALLVAHGGCIVALTASVLGWPIAAWSTLHPLPNCRWAVLEHREDRGDRWRLMVWGGGPA